MGKTFLTVILLASVFSAFGQVIASQDKATQTNAEKILAGKAYIDACFPNCDINDFAPNNIFKQDFSDDNARTEAKLNWISNYRHEYELYMYYHKKLNESTQYTAEPNSSDMQQKEEEILKNKQNK